MNSFPVGLPEILIIVVLGALGYVAFRALSKPTN
jgi:hypothetical protein